jgi:hypothetical protein
VRESEGGREGRKGKGRKEGKGREDHSCLEHSLKPENIKRKCKVFLGNWAFGLGVEGSHWGRSPGHHAFLGQLGTT